MDSLTALVPTANGHDIEPAIPPEELEKTATFLASEYKDATAAILRHMEGIQAECRRLHEAFMGPDDFGGYGSYFSIEFGAYGTRYYNADDRIFKQMERKAWEVLVDHLGVKNIMSVKQREQFERQLESGELPPIAPETIAGLVSTLVSQAKDFAVEAAREVFDILRPQRGEYKTNDKYRVGKRVILSYFVERAWGVRYRVNYYREKHLRAIDAVFHLLAGRGVIRDYKTPLIKAIEECEGGRGETDFFRFKCFKNCNLHLEFKDLELVKQLNLKAVGEYVLGLDEDA